VQGALDTAANGRMITLTIGKLFEGTNLDYQTLTIEVKQRMLIRGR